MSDRRTAGVWAAVAALHATGLALLALAVTGPARGLSAFSLGTGLLAYALGLRHALDADHIAAIDNVTRRLGRAGRRPAGIGFAFSLGHSTIVLALVLLLALGGDLLGAQVRSDGSALHVATGTIGPLVSSVFLLTAAAANVLVLRAGSADGPTAGPLGRLLARPALLVDRPWKMFPLGLLFGLGFDTATEIGLLVLAGTGVVAQLPVWALVSLPLLFAAGMTLADSADATLMGAAYAWSADDPGRRRRYDLTLTGLSVAVAVAVGGLQLAQLVHERLGSPIGPLEGIDPTLTGGAVITVLAAIFVVGRWATPALARASRARRLR
jgi:high-affinity nickel-transport protein